MIAPTLLALIYWVGFCYRANSLLKSLIKTGSVGLLALVAVMVKAPILLAVGLGLGAVGDWFLSRDHKQVFLIGLLAFAAAHLAYIALILGRPASAIPAVPVALLLLLCAGIITMLWPRAGELRWPVTAYVIIIGAMGLAAMIRSDPAVWLAAGLFIASDILLAVELFVLRPQHPLRRVTPFAIWALYWLAQAHFLYAFGLRAAP